MDIEQQNNTEREALMKQLFSVFDVNGMIVIGINVEKKDVTIHTLSNVPEYTKSLDEIAVKISQYVGLVEKDETASDKTE